MTLKLCTGSGATQRPMTPDVWVLGASELAPCGSGWTPQAERRELACTGLEMPRQARSGHSDNEGL